MPGVAERDPHGGRREAHTMRKEAPMDATAANLKAFDAVYTRRAVLAAHFKYNMEAARKEFVSLLADMQVPRTGRQVLDVGFGAGMLMFEFDTTCRLHGVEISKSALAMADRIARRRGYRDPVFVEPKSPGRLPFDDASFDVVIASHVIEHVREDIGFITELLRVLTPTGWLFIIGPLDNSAPGLLDDQALVNPAFADGHYHVRNYNAETFVARVARAGGIVRRSRSSMETWDWKVSQDAWRARLSTSVPGRILDRGIAVALNVPLSLAPLSWLRALDRFWARRGYQPRQIALAVQRQ